MQYERAEHSIRNKWRALCFIVILLFTQGVFIAANVGTASASGNPMVLYYTTTAANTVVELPFEGTVNVQVFWGDSGTEQTGITADVTHTFVTPGNYQILVYGTATRYGLGSGVSAQGIADLTSVSTWGDFAPISLSGAFVAASSLTSVPSTLPSSVTNTSYMFQYDSVFNSANISNWTTTNVTDMSGMFYVAPAFNQPLNWDTSNVGLMTYMFYDASAFNQSIGGWTTTNTTSMTQMLDGTAMSIANYNTLLQDWGSHGETHGAAFGAAGLAYTAAYVAARSNLTAFYGWTITGDTQAQIAITTAPAASATDAVAFTTQPVVKVENATGGVLTSQNGETVTATIASGTGGTLLNATASLVNGVATFSSLTLDGPAGNFTLSFNIAGMTATTGTIALSVGAAYQLVITTQPPATVQSGISFTTQPVVKVEDVGGQVVTSDTSTVTAGSTIGSTVTNATATAVGGVATFSGLTIAAAASSWTLLFTDSNGVVRNTSTNITVAAGIATKLVITTEPSATEVSGAVLITQPVVKIEDAAGNVVTSNTTTVAVSTAAGVTVANSTAAAVSGSASFSGLQLTGLANNYTLSFSDGALTSVNSTAVALSAASASQLVITTQPSTTATDGAAFATQPAVTAKDPSGNVDTAASGTVNASIVSGTNGTLTHATATFVNGVATFSGLTLTGPAGNFTLQFNGDGLTSPSSSAINLASGTASKIAITTQPSTTATDGAVLTVVPVISIEDAEGNVVSTINSGAATASLASGTGSLSSTSANFAGGIATFSGLSLTGPAGNLTLQFSGDSFSSAASNSISLSLGDAMVIAYTTTASSPTIDLPLSSVSASVAWGDGSAVQSAISGDVQHTYASPGTYYVAISGSAGKFNQASVGESDISQVVSFGNLGLTDLSLAFDGATNLTSVPTALPLSVTNLSYLFAGATSFNQNIDGWGIGNVGNLSGMFDGATSFNQPLNGWNTANVTDMTNMFYGATSFNQDLNSWVTTSVLGMGGMFESAYAFNGNIGSWDTSSVKQMSAMFRFAGSMNQSLNSWDTGNVTDMSLMFSGASVFNGDVHSWHTGNVKNMFSMFVGAVAFASDISLWDTSKVTDMGWMFYNDNTFDGNLSQWHTGAVTDMSLMFDGDRSFNQYIGGWDTTNVTDMHAMFASAATFNQDISGWNTANVTNTVSMFSQATLFNQNLGSWVTTKVVDMTHMLDNTDLSVANYDALLIGWAANTEVSGITLGVSGLYYLPAGAVGRAMLTGSGAGNDGWTISGDTEAKLAITVQPSSVANSGSAFARQPLVALETSSNAVITNFSGDTVTATVASGAGSLANETATFTNGVATFSGLTLSGVAGAYTLQFNGDGLTTAPSSNITLSSGVATQLVISTGPPGTAISGTMLSTQPVISLEDSGGNVVMSTDTVTATIASGAGAVLTNATASFVNGVATFSGLTITGLADNYTLQFATSSLVSPVSTSIALSAGTAMTLTYVTTTPSTVVELPLSGTVYATVNWGDGNMDDSVTGDIQHTYVTAGTYNISINGAVQQFGNGTTALGISDLTQVGSFGSLGMSSLAGAFGGATELTVVPTNLPSTVTSLDSTFSGDSLFNGDVSNWNTANVTDMDDMFGDATSFNESLNGWNTANVIDASWMFADASAFNGNISSWNVGNVTNSSYMFLDDEAFNQNLSNWSTGSDTDMSDMFSAASAFNSDLHLWDTSHVIDMDSMFAGATAFNSDLHLWDTSHVTNMNDMFGDDTAFDENLSAWDTSQVAIMTSMLDQTSLSVANYDALLESWGTKPQQMGVDLGADGLVYAPAAVSSRSVLVGVGAGQDGWTIDGDSEERIVITTQPPTTARSGIVIATQPVVKIEGGAGQIVTSADPGTVTASIVSGVGSLTSNTATFTNGVGTFSGITLTGTAGNFTLQFNGDSLTSLVSQTITLSAGTASQLVITTEPPATANSGAAFSTQPVVRVEDAANNVETSLSSGSASALIASGTSGSLTNSTATFSHGVASFSALALKGPVGNFTLQFMGDLLTSALSGTIVLSAGVATQLAITTETPGTASSAVALSTQPVVTIEDSAGNAVTNVNTGSATARVATGTGGSLSSNSAPFSNGVATFSGLALTGPIGNFTLSFSGDTFTSLPTNTIVLSAGPATQLLIATEPPGTANSGTVLSTQPSVKVADSAGNTVTSVTTGSATATVASGTNGTLTNLSASFSNGVATFSGLTLTGTIGNFTLQFGGDSFVSSVSTNIALSAGTASQLAIVTQPPATATSGAVLSTQPVVAVEDSAGNTVTSVTTGSATASVASGANGSLANRTANFSNGVATFSGLSLSGLAGNFTLQFSGDSLTSSASNAIALSVGAALQLVVTTPPSNTATSGAALSTQPVVTVEDSGGNTVTSVTTGSATASIVAGSGGSLTNFTAAFSNGVATFTGLTLSGPAGNFTLHFVGDSFTSATTGTIVLSSGAATQLVITTAPSSTTTSGAVFATQPVVTVEDAAGNPVTSVTTGSATASIVSGSGGALTSFTAAFSNGVATFSGLILSGTAGNFTLHFVGDSFTSSTTGTITLSAGTASQLVIVTGPPATAISGNALSTQPVVQVEDASGNVVTSLTTGSATASIASGTGGSLVGNSANFTNGVATFSGLKLSGPTGNFTLQFSGDSFVSLISSTIALSGGTATQLVITTEPPATANNGVALSVQPVVSVEDAFGNVITSVNTGLATAAISSGTGGVINNITAAFTNGVATFSALALTGPTGSYQLQFSGDGFTSPQSSSIALTAGSAMVLKYVTTAPSTAIALPMYGADSATVDWGDGSTTQSVVSTNADPQHTFATAGTYYVAINGTVPLYGSLSTALTGAPSTGSADLIQVVSFGSLQTTSFFSAFFSANHLVSVPTSLPSSVTNLKEMFSNDSAFNEDLSNWNTSNVTSTDSMFSGATMFNGNISTWTTSQMTDMSYMFYGATAFNSNISNWNTTNVTTFDSMFDGATAFNGAIGTNSATSSWVTSSAVYMNNMFNGASSFNQNIDNWNTSAVQFIYGMFSGATSFNQNIGNWSTGAIIDMAHMFDGATSFNQTLSWDTSKVTDMSYMFQGATSFNRVVAWNTAKVTNMSFLFAADPSFNQSLNSWTTTAVTNMNNMFNGATSFNQSLSNWITSSVTDMSYMFNGATSFNQSLSSFDTSKVTTMIGMFRGATSFNQSLAGWVTSSVTSMNVMLDSTALSAANYDATLEGWASKTEKSGVILGVLGLEYSPTAVASRNQLTGIDTWTIIGDSVEPLLITTQPLATASSGVALTSQPAVTFKDAAGNVDTSVNGLSVTAAIYSGSGAVLTNASTTFVNGVGTFSGLAFVGRPGNFTLQFTSEGLTSAVTGTIVLSVGPATQLAITTEPPAAAQSGTAFGTQSVVAVEDSAGNLLTSVNSGAATAAIYSGSGAVLTNMSTPFVNGVGTFSNLTLTGIVGNFTLQFNGDGLTSAATSSIALSAGPASQLVITTEPPTTARSGIGFTTQPAVSIEDASGNIVTSINSGSATASISSGTGGALTNTSTTFVNGVGAFSGLTLTGVIGNFTLKFSGDGYSSVSTTIALSIGIDTQLAIKTQPSVSPQSGAVFPIQPVVSIEDASGNVDTSVNALSVTASIYSGTGGVLTNTSTTFVNGVGTYSGLILTGTAGSFTLQFSGDGFTVVSREIDLAAGTATQMVILTEPPATASSGVTFSQHPVAVIEDASGNRTGNELFPAVATISSGIGGTLAHASVSLAASVFTFTSLSLSGPVGTYTLQFAAQGFTTVESTPITLSAGPASQLAITTEPSTTASSGAALATQPAVTVEDAAGNAETSLSTGLATVSILSGTGGSLTNTTASFTNGIATFGGLVLTGPAGNFTVKFTGDAFTSPASTNIALSAGTATQLLISTGPPPNAQSGIPLTTQPIVTLEDSAGNVVSYNGLADAQVATGTATPSGNAVSFANGVAAFTSLTLTGLAGTDFLQFSGDGLTSAVSTSITLSAGAASQLVITTEPPSSARSGVVLSSQPVVAVEDSAGNVVVSVNSGVATAAIASGTGGSLANVTTAFVNGVGTFVGLSLTGPVGSFTLQFSGDSVTSAASTPIALAAGAASQLVITTEPPSTARSGVVLSSQPVVAVEDAFGNVVTTVNTGLATATITAGTGGTLANATASFVNGIATFGNLTLTGTVGVFALGFSGDSLTSVTSTNITLSAGTASQLIITTEPSVTASSGTALATQPVVTLEDAVGNVLTGFSMGSATASIFSGTGASLLNVTTNFVNGTASFSGLTLTGTTGNYTLQFSGDSLTTVASSTITLSASSATQLVITTEPSATATSGDALSIQPVVKIEDASGNVVTTGSSTVTAAITTGGISVINPSAVSASGVAAFNALALTALAGTYTLTFSDGTLASTVSTNIVVSAGSASQLVITTEPPSTAVSGTVLSTQPAVTLEDAAGNIATTVNSGVATASIATGAGGSLANITASFVNGVATFNTLSLSGPVGNFTLQFTGDALVTGVSATVSLSAGAASQLVITTEPPGTANSGAALTTQPVVKVEDASGNVVTSINSGSATAAIATGTGGTLTDITTSFANGVATFKSLTLSGEVGNFTLQFGGDSLSSSPSSTIALTAGTASQLVISTQPPANAQSGVVLTSQPIVKVEDSSNNVVTSINSGFATAAIAGGTGGVLTNVTTAFANGVATFNSLTLSGPVGNFTLQFSGDTLTSTPTTTISLSAGAASQLVISTQPPAHAQSGVVLTSQPIVSVEDSSGNVVSSINSGSATAVIATGTGGTLTNATTSFANGVATFSSLTLAGSIGNFTLQFAGDSLTSAPSTNIALSAGNATQLVISTEPPANAQSGVVLTSQPIVIVEDSSNNVVTSINSGFATAAIATGTGGLLTSNSATFVNGIATFDSLTLRGPIGNFTLQFSGDSLVTGVSTNIALSAGNASQLVITTEPPANAQSGTTLTSQPVVTVEDNAGNVVTSVNSGSAIAAIATGSGGSLTSSTSAFSNGVAIFNSLTLSGPVGNFTLQFSGDALVTGGSTIISLSAGTASQLVITTEPSANAQSGVSLAAQPVVKVEDAAGNVVTSINTGSSTVSIATGTGGTLTNATTSFSNGVATFNSLTLSGPVGNFTLQFSGDALTSGPSTNIALSAGNASQLVISTEPPANAQSGVVLTSQPIVTVEDSSGNVVTSLNLGIATAAIATGTGGTLTNATASFVNGVAIFNSLTLSGPVGNFTLQFSGDALTSVPSTTVTLSAGMASQLVISTEPPANAESGVVLTSQPAVTVEDSSGNVVTSVNSGSAIATIATGSGGSLTSSTSAFSNGVATFNSLTLSGPVGNFTLQFSGDSLVTGVSTNISLSAGNASQLVISTEPSANAQSGVVLTSQPVVTVEDSSGNIVTSVNLGSATAAISTGTGGTLTNISASFVNGVAAFSSLTLSGPVGNFTLQFTGDSLTSAPSTNIALSAGNATQLVISTEPPAIALSGITLTTPPVVSVEDASGNVVTSVNSGSATTTIATGTGGSLTNATATFTSGVATFNALRLSGPVGNFTLQFSGDALTSPISSTIALSPGAASRLLITTEPSATAQSGIALTTQPTITVEDASGNIVTSVGSAATATIASGVGGTLANATTSFTNGVATFNALDLSGPVGNFRLQFRGDALTTVASTNIALTAGTASQLVISTEPPATAQPGIALTVQPVVTVEDAAGNTVTTVNSLISASIASGVGGTLSGATSNFSNGVGAFSGLTLAGPDGNFTLQFSGDALTSLPSTTIALSTSAGGGSGGGGSGGGGSSGGGSGGGSPTGPSSGVTQSANWLSISAPATDTVGTSISGSLIAATLGDVLPEDGTISIMTFGPSSTAVSACNSGGTMLGTIRADGDATYDSPNAFTPTSAGVYWWFAQYSDGDPTKSVASPCGVTMIKTIVNAAPVVTTKIVPVVTFKSVSPVYPIGRTLPIGITCRVARCSGTIDVTKMVIKYVKKRVKVVRHHRIVTITRKTKVHVAELVATHGYSVAKGSSASFRATETAYGRKILAVLAKRPVVVSLSATVNNGTTTKRQVTVRHRPLLKLGGIPHLAQTRNSVTGPMSCSYTACSGTLTIIEYYKGKVVSLGTKHYSLGKNKHAMYNLKVKGWIAPIGGSRPAIVSVRGVTNNGNTTWVDETIKANA